ncbi:MAG: hypothetical protein QOD64_1407, partial [Verrucomicrobiota bacterium]
MEKNSQKKTKVTKEGLANRVERLNDLFEFGDGDRG